MIAPIMPHLTTVMYHYVRPVADSDFPRLKALELQDFLGQLDHLQEHYDMISPQDLMAALDGKRRLPPRPCLLTFDDGYCDHYHHVFPALAARGLRGLFFAPRSSLIERHMLDVNRVQFTLAAHPAPEALADELDTILHQAGVRDIAGLRAAYYVPNRYDGASVAYVKQLLQHALPCEIRMQVTRELFRLYVSDDEASFAQNLYLASDQALEMRAAGMEFGGHGDLHLWHAQASPAELAREVSGAATVLNAIGAPVGGGFYCYPFGSENNAVETAVRNAGFALGFTVVPGLWPTGGDRLRISRLDTNDLPRSSQPDCPWLARATASRPM